MSENDIKHDADGTSTGGSPPKASPNDPYAKLEQLQQELSEAEAAQKQAKQAQSDLKELSESFKDIDKAVDDYELAKVELEQQANKSLEYHLTKYLMVDAALDEDTKDKIVQIREAYDEETDQLAARIGFFGHVDKLSLENYVSPNSYGDQSLQYLEINVTNIKQATKDGLNTLKERLDRLLNYKSNVEVYLKTLSDLEKEIEDIEMTDDPNKFEHMYLKLIEFVALLKILSASKNFDPHSAKKIYLKKPPTLESELKTCWADIFDAKASLRKAENDLNQNTTLLTFLKENLDKRNESRFKKILEDIEEI